MEPIIGIGLPGYRSFGHADVQYVSPLAKVNLIAGQNNAGKSNLLRAVDQMLQRGSRRAASEVPLDAQQAI